MANPLRVLIVEDSDDDARLVARELERGGYHPQCQRVETPASMRAALEKDPWDLVVADHRMPYLNAPAALTLFKQMGMDIPFLVFSGNVNDGVAVELLRAGANDCIAKEHVGRLLPAVQRELKEAEDRRERRKAEELLREAENKFRSLVEESLDGLYIIQEGRWTYVNPRLAEIFGYTQDEIVKNKTVLDLVDPSSRSLVEENIRKRMAGEIRSLRYTLRGIRKDGTTIDIEVHGRSAVYEGKPAVIGSLRDITERKRVEDALRESEERFRELLENANDFVYTHDLQGRFTSANTAVERLSGYTREEFLNLAVAEVVPAEFLERAREQIRRKVAGDVSRTTYELEIIGKDGRRIPVEVSTRLVYHEGKPVAVQGICRDITERKQAEKAIKDSEALYHSLVETLPLNVFRKDLDGRFTFGNQRFCNIIGKPLEEIVGKTDFDFFPRELAEKYRRDDLRAIETGQVFEDIEEHCPPGGGKLYVEVLKTPVHDFQGRPVGIQGMFWDITARKQAEEERDRFFTISVDMLCIAGFDGYFKRLNPSWEKALGFSNEELLSKPCMAFIHPEDQERTRTQVKNMFAGSNTIAFENRYLCKDGSYKWLLWNSTPYPEQKLIYAVAHDITSRKAQQMKLEKRTKQLQQLAFDLQEIAKSERGMHEELKKAQSQLVQSEKLTALGQMVAGVAHEINNPLAFVSNNVAVLQRDMKALRELLRQYQSADALLLQHQPDLHRQIQEYAEQVDIAYTLGNLDELLGRSREGLRRIQQIVGDLRDFARLDESDLQEVDLNGGIESTVNIIRGRAKKQGVELELELGELPSVTCYPAKINQVVLNLVVNALDATPEGGKVTVRTAAQKDGVEIHVIDTGEGIPPAIQEKIFDPFFTTKPVGQGTGLGLSISYGIIQDHGGRISLQSQVGKGTHFTVFLPRKPPGMHSS